MIHRLQPDNSNDAGVFFSERLSLILYSFYDEMQRQWFWLQPPSGRHLEYFLFFLMRLQWDFPGDFQKNHFMFYIFLTECRVSGIQRYATYTNMGWKGNYDWSRSFWADFWVFVSLWVILHRLWHRFDVACITFRGSFLYQFWAIFVHLFCLFYSHFALVMWCIRKVFAKKKTYAASYAIASPLLGTHDSGFRSAPTKSVFSRDCSRWSPRGYELLPTETPFPNP